MLLDGTGTAKDPNKAKVFLRRACDGTQARLASTSATSSKRAVT
jgi:hypothetical protein